MKWDSLNYGQQKRLNEMYDESHGDAAPEKPEFHHPGENERTVVAGETSNDIYVRMTTRRHMERGHEAQGELRLVGASEHIRVGLPDSSTIRALIGELERLADDIDAYNVAQRAHVQREREYEAAHKAYVEARERHLREGLKSGKYKADDIAAWADIPF